MRSRIFLENHKILWLDLAFPRPKNHSEQKANNASSVRFVSENAQIQREGTNEREEENMVNKEKPETLIQLLASYRHVSFPISQPDRRDLAGSATTIQRNCALTVYFADKKLRNVEQEGEEVFALLALREEATVLKRRCAAFLCGVRVRNLSEEVESLRRQYDNFSDSVRYLFQLLDRSLARRLDGVL